MLTQTTSHTELKTLADAVVAATVDALIARSAAQRAIRECEALDRLHDEHPTTVSGTQLEDARAAASIARLQSIRAERAEVSTLNSLLAAIDTL